MFSWSKNLTRISNFTRQTINKNNLSKFHANKTVTRATSTFHKQQSKYFIIVSSLVSTRFISALAFKMDNEKTTLDQADKLFDDNKFDELEQFLKGQKDWENNAKLLWRVARCEFQLSKKAKDKKAEHDKLLNDAYEHVKKSVELDDKDGLAQKWAAILLDAVSTLKGTKERVLQILNVRNHMELAIKYAPTDPTSYYLLGEWHFGCYQVSWWERKLASIAFGKLPDADMEVALKMFEKAEEVEKDFYSKNKLMLAKTLLELKRDQGKAKQLLEEVVSKYSSSDNWDDKEAVEAAGKLLKEIA